MMINPRFRTDTRELPVLWHQSLLSFVQNYRQDISTGLKIYSETFL
jgi:essential nuclear protein 1